MEENYARILGLPIPEIKIKEGKIKLLLMEYKRHQNGKEVRYPFDIFKEDVNKEEILELYSINDDKIYENEEGYSYYETYEHMMEHVMEYSGIEEQFEKLKELLLEIKTNKMNYFFSLLDRINKGIENAIIFQTYSFSNIK